MTRTLALILVLSPATAFGAVNDLPTDPAVITTAIQNSYNAMTAVFLNLISDTGSPIYQGALIIFSFLFLTILVLAIIRWVWEGQNYGFLFLALVYLAFIGVVLFVKVGSGTPYVFAVTAVGQFINAINIGLLSAGAANVGVLGDVKTTEDIITFFADLSYKIVIDAVECKWVCTDEFISGAASFLLTILLSFLAMEAAAFMLIGRIMINVGYLFGMLIVPLLLFDMGRNIAMSFLKFMIGGAMLIWLTTVLLMIVFALITSFLGINTQALTTINQDTWSLHYKVITDLIATYIVISTAIVLMFTAPRMAAGIVGARPV